MKLYRGIGLTTLLLVALILGACTTDGQTSTEVVLDDSYYTDLYDYDNADTFLGRGINMGNYLEAPASFAYPGGEGEWTGGRLIQQTDFAKIKAAGFKTVRIPVRWSDHAGDNDPYTIDAAFMARVKTVVDMALAEELIVVLNTHHYVEMMNDGDAALSGHEERLEAIWDQICDTFTLAAYPADDLVFELLNEPNAAVDYPDWNRIVSNLTSLIWTDKGQTDRKIMIGTANWGGPEGLDALTLPAACNSGNTIITIHWYKPFNFTHQGASWVEPAGSADAWIGTAWTGSTAEQQPLIDLLDSVTTWNSASGRGFEVFMGEFGVYTKYADPAHQQAWTAFIAREAEARDMSWAYWEFDRGFGAYNPVANGWRPALLDALIPVEDRP